MNFVSRLENYLEVAFKVVMMFGAKYFTLPIPRNANIFFLRPSTRMSAPYVRYNPFFLFHLIHGYLAGNLKKLFKRE